MDNEIKYWLHRISHEWDVSYKLLDKGYISIGWSNVMNTNILECREKNGINTENFEQVMNQGGYGSYRARWSLWYFLSFEVGDYIIVPLFEGEFSIFRVCGRTEKLSDVKGFDIFQSANGSEIVKGEDGFFRRSDSDTKVDLGFVAKVEPIKEHLSRYKYAGNKLTARMKIRQTNANISDLSDEINNIICSDTPIDLYRGLLDELAGKLLETLRVQLTPGKFELLVKWYLEKIGASKVYIPAKNESGKYDGADADVIAEFDALKIMVVVQVKFHDDTTSGWAIEQIQKYISQRRETYGEFVALPWVVTSADSFSVDAISKACESKIRLISGIDFARMLIDAGITDINCAFE